MMEALWGNSSSCSESVYTVHFHLNLLLAEDKTRFKVLVQSDMGSQEDECPLPFIDQNQDWRKTVIKALETETFDAKQFQEPDEQSWMIKAALLSEDRESFHPDLLKNVGQALYQVLFSSTGRLKTLLDRCLGAAQREDKALHMKILFQEDSVSRTRFADYPWELLHDGDQFLAHHRVFFSRHINHISAPPSFKPTSKINVLFISPSYNSPEFERLPQREVHVVSQALKEAQEAGDILFTQLEHATSSCLRKYLLENHGSDVTHVVHFEGHGFYGKRCSDSKCKTHHKGIKVNQCRKCGKTLPEAQGYLVFENEQGAPDFVNAEEFGVLLRSASGADNASSAQGVTLVVLSACQSGMAVVGSSVFNGVAQNLVNHRVPAVVAMQYSVTAGGAIRFSECFYQSLLQENSLIQAVSHAREAMGISTQQWFRPVLYLRSLDNESGKFFRKAQSNSTKPSYPKSQTKSNISKEIEIKTDHKVEACFCMDLDVNCIESGETFLELSAQFGEYEIEEHEIDFCNEEVRVSIKKGVLKIRIDNGKLCNPFPLKGSGCHINLQGSTVNPIWCFYCDEKTGFLMGSVKKQKLIMIQDLSPMWSMQATFKVYPDKLNIDFINIEPLDSAGDNRRGIVKKMLINHLCKLYLSQVVLSHGRQ